MANGNALQCFSQLQCLNGDGEGNDGGDGGDRFAFEGIRQNTPDADLNGWAVCHSDLYGQSNTQVQDILDNCNREFVMMGCRQVGQANWQLLAMGDRESVFTDTGVGNEVNNHNGVDWYFNSSRSMGFASPGTGVNRNSCDTANVLPEQRMCWHTSDDRLTSGYRCGRETLNGNNGWERRVWTSGAAQ